MAREADRRRRARGSHVSVDLRRRRSEAIHHRNQRRGGRARRLRPRRLARRVRAERHSPRDGERRDASFGPWRGADQSAVSQPARRHVRGRDRSGRAAPHRDGPPASAPAITTTTDGRICSSPTTAETCSTATIAAPGSRTSPRPPASERGRALGIGLHLHRLRPRRPARSVRRPTTCGSISSGRRTREGTELPVEGRAGQLRPQGAADRYEPPLPQSRQRCLRGRVGRDPASRA